MAVVFTLRMKGSGFFYASSLLAETSVKSDGNYVKLWISSDRCMIRKREASSFVWFSRVLMDPLLGFQRLFRFFSWIVDSVPSFCFDSELFGILWDYSSLKGSWYFLMIWKKIHHQTSIVIPTGFLGDSWQSNDPDYWNNLVSVVILRTVDSFRNSCGILGGGWDDLSGPGRTELW